MGGGSVTCVSVGIMGGGGGAVTCVSVGIMWGGGGDSFE